MPWTTTIPSYPRTPVPAKPPGERQCDHCRDDAAHYQHWFRGCTCGAGGIGTDHSDHCHLYGWRLLHLDELIVAELEREAA
jgi:hypothetical protein